MFTLKLKDRELNIKFDYKATVQTRLLPHIVEKETFQGEDMESVQSLLSFLPEFLLVGLQKFHQDEFGFNYETGEGKEEQLGKMYDIIEEYFDTNNDADAFILYGKLSEEMLANGFLKSLFQEMQKEKKQATKTTAKK